MRFLHTMIRVQDLDRSIHFYRDVLGFELRRRQDHEKGRFTLAFLGSPDGSPGEIELTYNWDQKEPYPLGKGYGHMAFRADINEVGTRLAEHGLKFSWGPGMTPSGKPGMAFIEDPDGYEIELLQE